MSSQERGGRRWYLEPETFIAGGALLVSVAAVVLGVYGAALQRKHDRAEVWPHLELASFTRPTGAALYLDNTGIGPAIVQQIVVTVDGRPAHSWQSVLGTLLGREPTQFTNTTVLNHGLRAGDRVTLIDLPNELVPRPFWPTIRRVGVSVCYGSVFDEHWLLTVPHVGETLHWSIVDSCPAQPRAMDF